MRVNNVLLGDSPNSICRSVTNTHTHIAVCTSQTPVVASTCVPVNPAAQSESHSFREEGVVSWGPAEPARWPEPLLQSGSPALVQRWPASTTTQAAGDEPETDKAKRAATVIWGTATPPSIHSFWAFVPDTLSVYLMRLPPQHTSLLTLPANNL